MSTAMLLYCRHAKTYRHEARALSIVGVMRLGSRQHHFGKSFTVPDEPAMYPGFETPSTSRSVTSDDSDYGVPDEVVAEALAHGASPAAWFLVKLSGASVEQAALLAAHGQATLLIGALAQMAAVDKDHALASFEEVADAANEVRPDAYIVARYAGLDHEEALLAARVDIVSLEAAVSRFPKDEVIEALVGGLLPEDYATFRRFASHSEAIEANAARITSSDYALAAGAGAAHQEIIAAVKAGSNLWDYARRRNLGLGAQPA